MPHSTLVALLAVTVVVAAPTRLAAQKNPAPPGPPPAWHFRVGVGVLAGTSGLGPALDLSLDTRRGLYRGRITVHDNTIASMGGAYRERATVFETAVMIGRGRRFTRNYGSVAAGLAAVTVERGEHDSTGTVGIPLEAQLISGGPLRLGATLIANLNAERPLAAFVLSVQFGRVP